MAIYTMRSGATALPEDSVLQFATDLIESGGVRDLSDDDHLLVSERGAGANMSVDIGVGRGIIKGSGNAYSVRNTTAINAAISNNTSGNPRKDAIVLYVDLAESPTSTADDVVKVAVVKGTPAASPDVPDDSAIQTAVGGSNPFLRLANVTVAHNETSIEDADIEDVRVAVQMSEEWIPNLTSKRITKRVTAITSSSTPTPNADEDDVYKITALAANATFGAPTGTPTEAQILLIRIKDNGTARTLSFNSGTGGYRAGTDVPLPTTTVVNKTMYLLFVWNDTDDKWDLVDVTDNI